jgi:hypothetical protein
MMERRLETVSNAWAFGSLSEIVLNCGFRFTIEPVLAIVSSLFATYVGGLVYAKMNAATAPTIAQPTIQNQRRLSTFK